MNQIITLGELIDAIRLKAKRIEPSAKIRFDFVYFYPNGLHSYRGYYDHLAFGYSSGGEAPLVSSVLRELESAEGADFTGYKGGEFTMHRSTPVWVANYNETGSTGVVDVKEYCGDLILETAHVE